MPTPATVAVTAINAYSTSDSTVFNQYIAVTGILAEDSSNNLYIQDTDGTKLYIYYKSPADALTALTADLGDNLTVNVILYSYNTSSSQWQAVFTNNTNDITINTMTDTQIVANAIVNTTLPSSTGSNLTLNATSDTVGITWVSDNTDVIGNDGTVTRPAAGQADAVVNVTGTFVLNAVSTDHVYTVTVKAMPSTDPMSVATAKTQLVGDTITVHGYVATVGGKGFVLQDADGTGIYVYLGSIPTVVQGDEVNVTSIYTIYKDFSELSNSTNTVVSDPISTGNALATPTTITDLAAFRNSDLDAFGQTYTFTNVTVTGVTSGQYIYFYLGDNGSYKIGIYLTDCSADVKAGLKPIVVGDNLTFTGTLYLGNGNHDVATVWRVLVNQVSDVTINPAS